MPDEATVSVKLRPLQPGVGSCLHPHRTWGFDPGTVTCSCGAKWRAVLPRHSSNGLQYKPDLEVIARTGEHANRYAVAMLLALGLVVEHHGKLVLTRAGKRVVR